MANFVLVHGAWLGNWCWQRTSQQLLAEGHRVYTPQLATDDGDLSTHIGAVTAEIETLGLQHTVLVGHSYAGMVISGVGGALGERVSQLVYLDAFVPYAGEALFDLVNWKDDVQNLAAHYGDGSMVPPPPLGHLGLEPIHWADLAARLSPFPLRAFAQPLDLPLALGNTPHCTHIRCTETVDPNLQASAVRAATLGWDTLELPATHCAMLTAPDRVADVLHAISQTVPHGSAVQSA